MTDVDEMRVCPKCGKSIKAIATRCVWCFEKIEPLRNAVKRAEAPVDEAASARFEDGSGSPSGPVPRVAQNTASSITSGYSSAVARRYRDAYSVAGEIVAQGGRVKALAIVVTVLLALGVLGAAMSAGQSALVVLTAGSLVAICAYAVIHAHGVRLAAQGQHLLATLDVAVNTSPFLDDRAKAQAMSLYPS